MAHVPGFCRHCGHVFDGRGEISIENSTDITVVGGRTDCPRCGREANLVDGTFSERGAGLELVTGPPLTRAILAQLQEVARQVEAKEITPEEAVTQVETLDPALGRLLRKIPYGTAITILLALITLYVTYEGNRSSDSFQRELLNLLRQQPEAVEILAGRTVDPPRQTQEQAGKGYTQTETVKKVETSRAPSKRRRDVNKARRQELIERRRMFPRRHRSSG